MTEVIKTPYQTCAL